MYSTAAAQTRTAVVGLSAIAGLASFAVFLLYRHARASSARSPSLLSSASYVHNVTPQTVLRAQADGAEDGGNPFSGGTALELRNQLARLDEQFKQGSGGDMSWLEIEGSYVLMPPAFPWGVIHFTGGAVLGTYPHVVYNELFMRVCRKAGVAVIATPYDLGLDHKRISAEAGAAFKRAFEACQSRYGWSDKMPVFGLGHSLGAKLQVLLTCTTLRGEARAPPRQLGLLAYNNFDLTDSVSMLEAFLKAFNQFQRPPGVDTAMLQGLFKVVETFTAAIGIQFSPNQAELRTQVKEQHDSAIPVTCFRFANDSLDCSPSLTEDISGDVIELPGDHLTPVYLKVGLDGNSAAAAAGIPAYEAFAATKWQVGDEEKLQTLADSIVCWLQGISQPERPQTEYRILPNGVIDV